MTLRAKPQLNGKFGYLPSLDGWRAIAILAVLIAHDQPWALHGGPRPIWQDWGGLGVNLFFSISGILITTRILDEEHLKGRFDIRSFYIRRIFRIQPAAIVYLLVIAVLLLAGVLHDHWRYWFGALFMYENFLWKGYGDIPISFFVGHFWSLAVEEHFYILLSLFLLAVRRFRLALLLSFWLALRIAEKIAVHMHITMADRRTYWQLVYLVLPAAVAVALRIPQVRVFFVRWVRPWAVFTLSAAIVLGQRLHDLHVPDLHRTLMASVGVGIGTLIKYVFPLWIAATMLHPEAIASRVLEWQPLRWIGKISYSLYLWHLLFFFRVTPETHVMQPLLVALSGRPAKYIAAFALAALSYYVIELPCMRLGHRLAPPRQAGRPELAA
jgi:peptidoglycan/LPS O-acetylase OafA/YrhL